MEFALSKTDQFEVGDFRVLVEYKGEKAIWSKLFGVFSRLQETITVHCKLIADVAYLSLVWKVLGHSPYKSPRGAPIR